MAKWPPSEALLSAVEMALPPAGAGLPPRGIAKLVDGFSPMTVTMALSYMVKIGRAARDGAQGRHRYFRIMP